MIKFSYRKDKNQKDKTVVTLNITVEDLADFEPVELVNRCTEYGYKIYLQGLGRDGTLQKHLESVNIPFEVSEGVPIAQAGLSGKALKLIEALKAKGMSDSEIEALLS